MARADDAVRTIERARASRLELRAVRKGLRCWRPHRQELDERRNVGSVRGGITSAPPALREDNREGYRVVRPARAPIKILPSQEQLIELFEYNPETGSLKWKFRRPTTKGDRLFNACYAGKEAGYPCGYYEKNRYTVVGLTDNNGVKAHRIIWKIMTGEEPPPFIDHKNSDSLDNRWSNLRRATNGQNMQNAKLNCNNKSGVKGVFWADSSWRATICVDKKYINIGRFKTIQEAEIAINYERARLHGEFARTGDES